MKINNLLIATKIIRDAKLHPVALKMYLLMKMLEEQKETISIKAINKYMPLNPKTYHKYIRQLKANNYIKVTRLAHNQYNYKILK